MESSAKKRTQSDAEDQPGGDASLTERPSRQRFGANELVSHLRTAIAQNTYRHGDRLPAERELAAQFGTSRGTARHAVRELERLNLVTRRVGSGTFVHAPGLDSTTDVAEITSPLELMEVRFALEPSMVRQAIVNASPRDLARLHTCLEAVENTDDPATFTEADEHLHLALAECTQNPLVVWLYRQINEVRGHARWSMAKQKILTTDRIAHYNEQHRQLYTAISTRDTSRALEITEAHLTQAKHDLLGVQN